MLENLLVLLIFEDFWTCKNLSEIRRFLQAVKIKDFDATNTLTLYLSAMIFEVEKNRWFFEHLKIFIKIFP